MTTPLVPTSAPRSAAIADLFDALDAMIIMYRSVPDADQAQRCSDDAERITGNVARHPRVARDWLAATIPAPIPEPR